MTVFAVPWRQALRAKIAGARRGLVLCCALALGLCLGAAIWWHFVPRPPLLEGLSFSTPVLDRNGGLLRLGLTSDEKYRIRTRLEDIAPELVEATLLYEDRHFYEHSGVSLLSLGRAALTALRGGRVMGASTITMQLARLRYNLHTASPWGKLVQMERALAIERHYGKAEILEAYFNLVPYGGNIEGAGAAARIYFHAAPRRLTLTECLSLVGVPQNPARRNPLRARESGPQVLDAVRARLSDIWLAAHPEDADNAFFHRLPLEVHSPAELPFLAPHAGVEALRAADGSGAPVRTTIDPRAQALLERQIRAFTARRGREGLRNACAVLLHWPSMEIRGLAGSADFTGKSIQGQVDGTTARRSPGSALKPFIYALALDQGLIHPKSLLYDAPRDFKGYEPANSDGQFKGPLSAAEALAQSRNIPAILLANRLRKPDLYAFLQRAHAGLSGSREDYGLALVLGGAEITPRALAALYALLANRGVWREPVLLPGLPRNADGSDADDALPSAFGNAAAGEEPARAGTPLLSPEAAALTLIMLRDNPISDRARHISGTPPKLPVYWKSGTSNGFRDAWAAGVFGPYVLVVWVGNFDGRPNAAFIGARSAGEIFFDVAEAVDASERPPDTALAHIRELNLARVPVCADTGDINTSLCPETSTSWFIPGVSPVADSGIYRSILVDSESGLRACAEREGRTRRETWAFWPTELQRMFRKAGLAKKNPPPYGPECLGREGQADFLSGRAPGIQSPKEHVVYQRSASRPQRGAMALRADADADVTTLFWFHGKKFIGRTAPGETLFWLPPGGAGVLRVLDDFGRSSSRAITVELAP